MQPLAETLDAFFVLQAAPALLKLHIRKPIPQRGRFHGEVLVRSLLSHVRESVISAILRGA
jgi:hypothetical protein